ncbi:MAG: PAS domain S-box protein [Deltaproteobacteria bacterium]|nr:PAS domain S-box protein [Deltaproteobacteria bacterium]
MPTPNGCVPEAHDVTEPALEPDKTAHQVAELRLLQEAFERFMGAGETVTRAYDELRARIDELNLQLEEKNIELARNLDEKERLSMHLSNILGSLRSGVVVLDGGGAIDTVNEAAANLLGRSRKELVGTRFVEVIASAHFTRGDWETMVAGRADFREREMEHRVPGGAVRTLRVALHPMTKAGEEQPGRVLVIDDVTREIRDRETAQRTDRLAAMGEMAVKIVHEVRNPMGSIELIASLLSRDLSDQPEQRQMVERVRNGIRSMNHTINNLLSFARNTQPEVRPVEIEAVVEDCLSYNTHLLETQHVALERNYRNGSDVLGDSELLKQVFMNLFLNAAQAMPGGGVLRVEIADEHRRDASGVETPTVLVRIADTGCGMSPEVSARVFHPFFTTKERGTGLGLALAHNIIQAHRGTIDVESEPGKGSCFTVCLPASAITPIQSGV